MTSPVSISTLGNRGRWGNQLHQIAAMRGIARQYGYELQVPADWIGRKLFEVPEGETCAACVQRRIDLDVVLRNNLLPHWLPRLSGMDVLGYFQSRCFLDMFSRADCRQWFALKPEWLDYEAKLLATLPENYAACHKRRGDYMQEPYTRLYATVSDDSYRWTLEKFKVPEPVLHVSEGWREPSDKVKEAGCPWLDDFMIVKNARVVLRSNSTFGWWACVLSDAQVYSPVVGNKVGWSDCEFAPGNDEQTANFPNQSRLELRET